MPAIAGAIIRSRPREKGSRTLGQKSRPPRWIWIRKSRRRRARDDLWMTFLSFHSLVPIYIFLFHFVHAFSFTLLPCFSFFYPYIPHGLSFLLSCTLYLNLESFFIPPLCQSSSLQNCQQKRAYDSLPSHLYIFLIARYSLLLLGVDMKLFKYWP